MSILTLTALAATLVAAVPAFVSVTPSTTVGETDTKLDVPPRYMWGWPDDTQRNSKGHCGEVSFQSHGI